MYRLRTTAVFTHLRAIVEAHAARSTKTASAAEDNPMHHYGTLLATVTITDAHDVALVLS